jgi:EAL domain-containing protein (putative c-di-GMP-specific phosphodiesterase class I)
VEDSETLALLAELGCDHAQGYFIARAMEGWELAPWLVEADGEGVVPIAAGRRSG